MRTDFRRGLLAVLLLILTGSGHAQIKIGATLSVTGPAASLGIPERDTIAMFPKEIAGQKIEYIVLDDASDTTTAVKNAKKLVAEDRVDLIIGGTLTTNTLAILDIIAEGATPAISLASSARIIAPMDPKRHWMFKTPQTDIQMASGIMEHAAARGVKTVAYIGQADTLGEAFYVEVARFAGERGIKVVANERFNPRDTSVAGQVLKIIAAKPDAVVIGSAGTPAALPPKTLVERGYKGLIYHNHGVGNTDFLRVCGKECEGTHLPASPVLVAAQLPDDHPAKKVALDYVRRYEAAYGAGTVTAFGAYAWDSSLLLQQAIPAALKSAKPGTAEFRKALRDALENIKGLRVTNGIVNMSATDHLGLDERARVMVRITGGKWMLEN
jgi:branched-chain amino acid transport system substrate-binding protein